MRNIPLLTQLARTDRNVSGQQLLQLLTNIDHATPEGHNSLRKNAFALMRIRRYRHAAAVFLLASPPMVSVVSDG